MCITFFVFLYFFYYYYLEEEKNTPKNIFFNPVEGKK